VTQAAAIEEAIRDWLKKQEPLTKKSADAASSGLED
jgi:hypothetical protein